jgi:hypothetical protein
MPEPGRTLLVTAGIALASFRFSAAAPLAIHIHSERAMFQVLISPGAVGTDSFVLQLMSGDGNLLGVKDATLVLSLPERGIEALQRKATLGADGLLARRRRANSAARALAYADRGPDRFPENHAGRRLRGAGAVNPTGSN